jgi:hypothetical protein
MYYYSRTIYKHTTKYNRIYKESLHLYLVEQTLSIPMKMSNEAAECITLRLKLLGSDQIEELEIPLDLATDSLFQLSADIFDLPSESLRFIFEGRALRPGGTLASYNITDQSIIRIIPKKKSTRAEDPPAPLISPAEAPHIPPERTLRNLLNEFQLTLAQANNAASHFQSALLGSDLAAINTNLENLNNVIPEIIQKLNLLSEPHFENMEQFSRVINASRLAPELQIAPAAAAEEGRPPSASEVFSAQEMKEISRISANLSGYAAENKLAGVYRASNLYSSLIK